MNNKKIHETLDELFENSKSRNFINHLVRAYVPMDNVKTVNKRPNNNFKCAITRTKLISCGDIIEGIRTKELDEELMIGLHTLFDEDKQVDNPIKNKINGKELGVTGKDTDTYMSYRTFQEFFSWVVKKMLEGNKHINWLLSNIDRTTLLERAEKLADDVDKIRNIDKIKNNGRATTSLGDLDVLKKLKKEMEN